MSLEMVKLNNICDIITCGVAARPEYVEEGVPFLSSLNVKENRFILNSFKKISQADYKKLNKYSNPVKGDILYTRVGSFGEAAVIDFDFDFSIFVSLTLIKPKKDIVDSRFLMWYLNSPKIRDFAKNNTSGIGVQNLNVGVVREYNVPLPPLPLQKRIAYLLDKADTLRKKDKQLLQHYDDLAQSLFIEMFGDPVKNEKKWEIKKLGDYFKNGVKCGPFGSALKRHEFIKEGVPVWNMDNIVNYSFDTNASLFITEQKFKDLSSYRVINGDIIISRAGTVGKMCVVESENHHSIISTNLIRLSLDDSKILPMYFVLLMKYFSSKIAKLKTAGEGAFTHMNTGVLTGLLLPVPPIALQNQFAQHILNIEQQKEKLKIQMQESENLFRSLLQKAFNGGLN